MLLSTVPNVKRTAKEMDNYKGNDYGILCKNIAQRQIKSGSLCGYLAYVEGVAVGWCNANNRTNYSSDPCCDVHFYAPATQNEMAVVCFEIAPEYRGKGIATALLQQVICDAKDNGYSSVVAFPIDRKERYEWDCTGPMHMFEKAGFYKVDEYGETIVMKKDLVEL